MTDEQKMLQRMAVMLLDTSSVLHQDRTGAWVHSPSCIRWSNSCSCCPIYISYTTDRDGDITVHEVRNNGKLRVRLGERG